MSTGDLKNNVRKLQAELKAVKYDSEIDFDGMVHGVPTVYLPIYHYVFVNYSRHLKEKISQMNIELYGKTDNRFMESVYKVLREIFSYKPPVTKEQFFCSGFAERKLMMCYSIVQMVREKHKSIEREGRIAKVTSVATNAAAKDDLRRCEHKINPAIARQNRSSSLRAKVINEARSISSSHLSSDSRNNGLPQSDADSPPRVPPARTKVRRLSNSSTDSSPSPRKLGRQISSRSVGQLRSSDACSDFPATEQKFANVNKSIQMLFSRLEVVETRLFALEGKRNPPESSSPTSPSVSDVIPRDQLSTLLARLTLVENKLTMLDAQGRVNTTVYPNYMYSGYNSVVQDDGDTDLARTKDVVAKETCSVQTESTDSSSVSKDVIQLTNEETDNYVKNIETDQSEYENPEAEPSCEQKGQSERIKSMIKETEGLLNIESESFLEITTD